MKSKELKHDWELWVQRVGKLVMKQCTYTTATEAAESFGLPYTITRINTLNIRRADNAVTERKRIV